MQNLWILRLFKTNFLSDQKHKEKHALQRSFNEDSKLPYKIIPTLFETKLN